MSIVFATASQLAQMIRDKEVSAVEVLDAYLEQIDKYNSKINAIVTLDAERARKRAIEADEALARGENWGKLHGVPITVKDLMETAGLLTTAGYPPLKDHIPSEDATTVARLKKAGAIILAKTNTPRLGGDYQTKNPIFGTTNNPWDLDCTPGGSSGGSASAVAAGFSPLDLGSDIGGSIRLPAHYCGIYGFMPTDRRVSTAGHLPPLPGQLQYIRHMLRLGPLARSVEDLQLCFSLIAGADIRQPDIPSLSIDRVKDTKLSELRIAWTYGYDFLPVSKDTHTCIQNLINRLSETGCQLEQCNPNDLDWSETLANYSALASYELFASASKLGVLPGIVTAIITEFYARTQTAFKSGTPLVEKGNLAFPPSMTKYNTILTERDRQIAQIDRFMDRWDAWICPVSMTSAFPHCNFGKPIEVDGVKFPYLLACGGYTMPLNFTGNPVVVMPIGQSKGGLPIGVQIVGKRWQDMSLLSIATEITKVIARPLNPPLDWQ